MSGSVSAENTSSSAVPAATQPTGHAGSTAAGTPLSSSLTSVPVKLPVAGVVSAGPGDLPVELTCRPTGLVVLTGLDTTYNAVHRAIWDSFSANRRPDRVPLNFKILPGDHEYPKCRSKQRTSYEWYIPKGIVKTSWMKKHLDEVPSLVVVFFDLDWDEQLWTEHKLECASKVEVVRSSLQGRGSKVAVVLIQKNAPLPPGEDVVAAERAAALCAACELSAKSLFVLPCVDHLLGYTIRLENAFYELAQSYYHTEARRVKAHKEFLNRTTHQELRDELGPMNVDNYCKLLFVRHAFKIAFFNELKQDTHLALKQYKMAYSHITELRAHDTNMLEIKTIAGFINYKICRLCFYHNTPLDAISQFRKHVDVFKSKIGCAELAFEHSAWMSKQFSIFGDLFDDAIKLGLTAIQTQHPGFYYQQAANHAIARKQLCRGLCHAATSMPTSNPLEEKDDLEFYGQRPWRQGHQSIDPPDPQMEKEGILALQFLESHVDHSWIIIPLLSSAVAQFKKYKSARMKRHLMVQMGEEYYHAKDYSKALTLLGRVTWDYRLERWWPLLTSILVTSLRCAYLVASVEEYVSICLELLGRYSQSSPDERTRVQMNLIRVMSNNSPEPEPGCSPDVIDSAKQLWKAKMSEQEANKTFRVEMRNLVPFVECKARFSQAMFTADSLVTTELYIRSSCQFPIRFSKLAIHLNNQAYNTHCVITDGQPLASPDGAAMAAAEADTEGDLYLMPGQVKVHKFQFVVLPEDVESKIEITSVALYLGDEAIRCAMLWWQGGGNDAASHTNVQETSIQRRGPPQEGEIVWENIKIVGVTNIHSRPAKVSIDLDHQAPCLVNEIYPIKISITNNEEGALIQPSLSLGLQEGSDPNLDLTTQVSLESNKFDKVSLPSRIQGITLGTTKAGSSIEKTMYVRCTQLGGRNLSVKIAYNVEVQVGPQTIPVTCTCHQEVKVQLQAVMPFDVSIKLASLKFEPIDHVNAEETFLLLTDIKCTSPWQIDLDNSELTLSGQVTAGNGSLQSQIKNVSLKEGENAGECLCLQAPAKHQSGLISLGTYTLEWRRKAFEGSLPLVKTILPLPEVTLQEVPMSIDTNIPAFGLVRSPLPVTFTIHNRTGIVQTVEANVEPSEAFMFSGHKQVFFRILPSNSECLSYNLYPLLPGYVRLPKLHLTTPCAPTMTEEVADKMMPSHIYIKPLGKELILDKK